MCGVDMKQFHNYAIEWAPNLLVGYIDGKQWFRFTGQVANAPGPMHQTIQLDNFGKTGNATFDVDWARVYR
jgi:acetyl-CoA carboxylase carboxyltransferase component